MTALREIPAHLAPCHSNAPTMVTASRVRERGWTDGLIRRLLGVPDDYAANTAYPGGAPVRLYSLTRVEQIEGGADFLAAKAKASKRQGASLKAQSTKRETALKWIAEQIGPKVPSVPQPELTRLAVDWWNQTHAWRGDCETWWTGAEAEQHLAPVTVDYILAQLHDYETRLRRTVGNTPSGDDLALIRGKILGAIAGAFPWLESECTGRTK